MGHRSIAGENVAQQARMEEFIEERFDRGMIESIVIELPENLVPGCRSPVKQPIRRNHQPIALVEGYQRGQLAAGFDVPDSYGCVFAAADQIFVVGSEYE